MDILINFYKTRLYNYINQQILSYDINVKKSQDKYTKFVIIDTTTESFIY